MARAELARGETLTMIRSMSPLRLFSIASLTICVTLPAPAQTRPLLTEQATTAAAGMLTLETGLDAMRHEPNFLTNLDRNVWSGPQFRLVYSPADNVELDLEWAGRVGQTSDPTFGSTSDWGDVSLRAKWRFQAERDGRPAMGVRFSVSLPETKAIEGLGPNTVRMSVQWLLTRSFSAGLRIHANAGLAIVDRPFALNTQSDFFAFGAALEKRATRELDLLAEVSGQAGHGVPGADQHMEARFGARFGKGVWRGDAALRRGLSAADGKWGFTAGAIFTLHKAR
jgi:Putative MetA-pathway of phenol degradation